VIRSSKGGHSKRLHISEWWRCKQKEHGEDLVQLTEGSGSSEHLGWGHRVRQDR